MKVAQICTNAMSGSVGNIVRNIALEVNKGNNSCVVFYSRGKEFTESYAHRFGNKFGIYLHAGLARLFDSDGLHSKISTDRLIDSLREYNPDIIHIHCLHGYYLNYKKLFGYFVAENKKVVWTMHDCWAFTGHCTYYDYIGCKRWYTNCYKCPQKSEYPKSILFDRSQRNYRDKKKTFSSLPIQNMELVTPSEWLEREIKHSFLLNYNVSVINNEVNTSIFNTNSSFTIEKRILGVANIWTQRKGLDDFIELSKVIPNNYKILIVGATEEQIKLLKRYGIQAIKRTSNQKELADLYRTSTILFNPTYEDNYPTVNVEAIACGLPVVTYETGGSPELVREASLGKIVRIHDYMSVVNYLDVAYSRPFFEWKYNNCMVNKYIQLYSNLIVKRKTCQK